MVFENIKRNDVVYGLTLTAAGVAVAHVLPSSRWRRIGIGLSVEVFYKVVVARWGNRRAKLLAHQIPAVFLAGIVAFEFLTQPAELRAAWGKGDLWAGIDSIRGLSFAVGIAAPSAWVRWRSEDQIFDYSEKRIEFWLDPDAAAFDHNKWERKMNPLHQDITGVQFLQDNGIPLDITVDFGQMSDEQIKEIILKTTPERLDISHVENVLKGLERESIVEGLKKSGEEAAAALENDSWVNLQDDYKARKKKNAEELRHRITELANARAIASRTQKRFATKCEVLDQWAELPKQQVSMLQHLSDLLSGEDENPDEEAVYVLQGKMTKGLHLWHEALGIEDLQEMESVLDGLGLKTRADLEKHGLLMKEDEKARTPDEVCEVLKAYREKCEAAGGGVTAEVVSFMATPSTFKEGLGPAARVALKVVGGVGYLAVWGACTMAHFQHKRGWFYLGASVAVIERVVWTREWRARDLGSYEGWNNSLCWALKIALWGEEVQAQWLNGNNIQDILTGEEPINRDLIGRAATFGARGPVAQARVLMAETSLSGLFSFANWWATPSDLRPLGQVGIGTSVIARSCVHTLCDTAMGLAQRGSRLVSNWRQSAVVGEETE